MARTNLSEDWSPMGVAPRDDTPVILWTIEDETPAEVPQPIGYWTLKSTVGLGYWRFLGEPPRFCSDRQIRGWKPLLRDR